MHSRTRTVTLFSVMETGPLVVVLSLLVNLVDAGESVVAALPESVAKVGRGGGRVAGAELAHGAIPMDARAAGRWYIAIVRERQAVEFMSWETGRGSRTKQGEECKLSHEYSKNREYLDLRLLVRSHRVRDLGP